MNSKPLLSDVDAVLHLLESCINFRVEVSLPDAATILERFPKYNDIPSNLSGLIHDLKTRIGPMAFPEINGRPNPNTGTFGNLSVQIGNEGSLVIYIKSRMFARKMDTAAMHKAVLQTIGRKYDADEVTVERTNHMGYETVKARLWWD
jgi:hypothetical protein